MLLGLFSVCCFVTSIAGTANLHRLAPEILSQATLNSSNSLDDATTGIFSEETRPRPIEKNIVLQNQEPRLCQNSEILKKILNILQKIITRVSSKDDMVSNGLHYVIENLKKVPADLESAELLSNLNDLEKNIEVENGTHKPVLRQNSYKSAPGKLKTKIVFKYELPSISHPNCKHAFEKLIKTANEAYIKLSNDPMCEEAGQNGNNQLNHKEFINPEQHHFNYYSYPEIQKNEPSDNSYNNDGSIPSNSGPHDLLFHIKKNKFNPNIIEMLQKYNLDHNNQSPKIGSIDVNGLELHPGSNNLYNYVTNDNDEIYQNDARYRHPNIPQKNNHNTDFHSKGIINSNLEPDLFNPIYQYDTNENFKSKLLVTDDLKSKIPIGHNEGLFDLKFPENINSPAISENLNNYQPNNDTDILNKYNLEKYREYHNNDGYSNDKNNDGSNVNVEKLPLKPNIIYSPSDFDYKKPNYQQYMNEIKNFISQKPNQLDINPDNENSIYHQDFALNTKYNSLDSVPMQKYNIHGVAFENENNPYKFNDNNGMFQINPDLNKIQNADVERYDPKGLANINGANEQNIAGPHLHYQPDLLHYGNHLPIEENTSPNLQHLLSITNLYKLNDLPHKADIIELTYMLKRSEPLVYQPFYIVKYRLPYIKFLNNVRGLILRKPYLRMNQEKLYQELIALSNVTETSNDLKGYPKEDIVKLTFNNGALVTAKILNANDTNINEQLNVIQNLNSNLNPEDILKLNKDNANKYYTRTENSISGPLDSKVSNNPPQSSFDYGFGLQYQKPGNVLQQNSQRYIIPRPGFNARNSISIPHHGNNIWYHLQRKSQVPVAPNTNLNEIAPSIIPTVVASQQALGNLNAEDILKLNKDNANKYYIRTGNSISGSPDSKDSNKPVKALRNLNYGFGQQRGNVLQQNSQRYFIPRPGFNGRNSMSIQQHGNNIWYRLQRKSQIPVSPSTNLNIIPAAFARQQALRTPVAMLG